MNHTDSEKEELVRGLATALSVVESEATLSLVASTLYEHVRKVGTELLRDDILTSRELSDMEKVQKEAKASAKTAKGLFHIRANERGTKVDEPKRHGQESPCSDGSDDGEDSDNGDDSDTGVDGNEFREMVASANGSSCIILDNNEDNEILRKTREAQQQHRNSGSSSGKKRVRSEPSTNANLVQGEPVAKRRIVQGMGQGKAAAPVASRISSSSSSSALHQILESPAIKAILATATAPAAAVPAAGADVLSRRIQNLKDIHELLTRGIITEEQAAKMKSDAMAGV
jgi:hypothetical protein